jgi:type IV secretion system protein VirD4
MPTVLSKLRAHLADPAAAWPARDRRLIPGPIAFYATGLALVLAAVAVGVLGYRLVQPLFARDREGARWATKRDLRPLLVHAPKRGRLTLGTANGALIAAETRQSVIVFGPTQTMKTTGLAIPAILEWDGPVIATSVKTDLLRDTINARRRSGTAWIYDPARTTGLERASWSPLPSCRTWSGAQRTASWLANSANSDAQGVENAAFWYAAATKLLAPVLHAAAAGGATMRDVIHWIDTQDKEEGTILQILDDASADDAAYAYQATIGRESRTKSNVYTTAETILAAYADPAVLDSSDHSDIAATLLNGASNTLYLAAPAHEQRRLRPLFATLIQELIAAAYEHATLTGKPLAAPLLLVLDECANIAPIQDLATLASTGAGQGIQLVTVFQDLAQVETTYGHHTAATIVSNHRAKLILSGIADPTTLEYASRLLGDEEVHQRSATRGYLGDKSTTDSTTYRNLAPAHALRQMPSGSGVLVYGHTPPTRIQLRPWFRDRKLRRTVEAGQ